MDELNAVSWLISICPELTVFPHFILKKWICCSYLEVKVINIRPDGKNYLYLRSSCFYNQPKKPHTASTIYCLLSTPDFFFFFYTSGMFFVISFCFFQILFFLCDCYRLSCVPQNHMLMSKPDYLLNAT